MEKVAKKKLVTLKITKSHIRPKKEVSHGVMVGVKVWSAHRPFNVL